MKKSWKGIIPIISLQKTTNYSPKLISILDYTVTDLWTIANTFNSSFCSAVTEVQLEVPFSYKMFFEYLPPPNQDSFFISPCTKEEIIKIISNFKPKKLAGPNSIPTKILRLLTTIIFSTSGCLNLLSKMGSMNYFGQVFQEILENKYLKHNFENSEIKDFAPTFWNFIRGKFYYKNALFFEL